MQRYAPNRYIRGPLAHLVEHLFCTQEASGSSPLGSTIRKTPPARCFSYGGRPQAYRFAMARRGQEHLGAERVSDSGPTVILVIRNRTTEQLMI